MIYQEGKASYGSALFLSVGAVLVTLVLVFGFRIESIKAIDAFLWVEGTALLACALQPDRVSLQKNPLRRWIDPGFVGSPSFLPLLYHLGLLMLSAAAVVGAFI